MGTPGNNEQCVHFKPAHKKATVAALKSLRIVTGEPSDLLAPLKRGGGLQVRLCYWRYNNKTEILHTLTSTEI